VRPPQDGPAPTFGDLTLRPAMSSCPWGARGARVPLVAEWLTNNQCAELAGIRPDTWRAYVSRGIAPEADRTTLGHPEWHRDTFMAWLAKRPGPGKGGGRPRKE